MGMIKIELVRSRIGALPKQRLVLDALGLRRMHTVREFQDTPAIRGMIFKVAHMVKVVSA
jgi:large subunit ribosomal protein L30